jgi:hypothetical protein
MTMNTDTADTILRELVAAGSPERAAVWDRACAWADAQKAPPTKAERVRALVDDGPFPGMSAAFDAHMGAECWTDPEYAPDASMWAAAWKAAQKAPQPEQPLAHRLISSGPNAGRVKPEYVQKAPQPRTAEPALSMKRHEWDSLSPEARKLIHDRTREHTLESARAAQAIRDTPLAEPAPAPADEPPPLPEPAWMTQLCGRDPHYFYTADQMRARDAYWIAKLQAERSKP